MVVGDETAEVEVVVRVLVVVGVVVGDVVVRMMPGRRGVVVVVRAGCVSVVGVSLAGVLVVDVVSRGRAGKKMEGNCVKTDGQEW